MKQTDAIRGRLLDLSVSPFSSKQRLTVEIDTDFRARYDALKDRDIALTIKPWRNKRSLDSNSYAWALIDELAAAMGITKSEVYRAAIRDIGGVSETVCVQKKAVDTLCHAWESNGLGWQTERLSSKLPGCVNVVLYYGSSVYDSRQMSALIDKIVQDCHAVGIETRTPEEIASMMEQWEGRRGNG